MWFSISAHGLASARDWKMCFGQFSRPEVPVKVVMTMAKLVCGVVPTARRLLLRHRGASQVRCSIIEDGGNLVWTSIMRSLPYDPKYFFHELVQSLDGVIELCRGLPEDPKSLLQRPFYR
jgi:LSD1 subclass zinc finger protein